MDKKFHLVNGEPKPCNANIRDCPIGGEHFNNEAEARASYESNSERNLFKKFNKDGVGKKKRRSVDEIIWNRLDKALGDDPSAERFATVTAGIIAGGAAVTMGPLMVAGIIQHYNVMNDYQKTPYSVSATVKDMGHDQDFTGTVRGTNLQNSHFNHCIRTLPKNNYVTCTTTDGKFTITAKRVNHNYKSGEWTELDGLKVKDNTNGSIHNLKVREYDSATYYTPSGNTSK